MDEHAWHTYADLEAVYLTLLLNVREHLDRQQMKYNSFKNKGFYGMV